MPKQITLNDFLGSQPAKNYKHLCGRIAKVLFLDTENSTKDYQRLRAIILGKTLVPPLFQKLINEEFGIEFHYPDPVPSSKKIQPVTADKDYREGVEL